jgi:hypothetical protein
MKMKKIHAIMVTISFLLIAIVSGAQEIKEVDGKYFEGEKIYTGVYKEYFENENIRIEVNILDGLKDGLT